MYSGYFSKDAISYLEEVLGTVNFTSCQRPNGTVYGTAGTCRKGTEIEQRRLDSINHLTKSISLLKEKRDKAPEEGKARVTRLINKLEADLSAIRGQSSSKVSSSKVQNKAPRDFSSKSPEKSRNMGYGFYGTTSEKYPKETEKRWEEASRGLQSRGLIPTLARRALDSSWGRHLADELSGIPTSEIRAKVTQQIDSQTPRQQSFFRKFVKSLLEEED